MSKIFHKCREKPKSCGSNGPTSTRSNTFATSTLVQLHAVLLCIVDPILDLRAPIVSPVSLCLAIDCIQKKKEQPPSAKHQHHTPPTPRTRTHPTTNHNHRNDDFDTFAMACPTCVANVVKLVPISCCNSFLSSDGFD